MRIQSIASTFSGGLDLHGRTRQRGRPRQILARQRHCPELHARDEVGGGGQHAEAAGHDWYEEVNGQGPGGTYSKAPYNFGQTGFSREHGHFTQVVWRATTAMGCGTKVCPELFSGWGDASVWVCQYDPGGNVGGKFRQNVGKLKPGC